VQPLWTLYSQAKGHPDEKAVNEARERIGMGQVLVEKNEIRFLKPGMSITLNGIAQGYITDRITDLLKNEGHANVLVELGEKRAIGGHPQGRPWRLGLEEGGTIFRTVELKDKALATSAASGMIFDAAAGTHHIFDPHTGLNPRRYGSLSVLADNATTADALSTGFTVMDQAHIRHLEKNVPGIYKVILVENASH
jgi:FAD:protein FMN transferase